MPLKSDRTFCVLHNLSVLEARKVRLCRKPCVEPLSVSRTCEYFKVKVPRHLIKCVRRSVARRRRKVSAVVRRGGFLGRLWRFCRPRGRVKKGIKNNKKPLTS